VHTEWRSEVSPKHDFYMSLSMFQERSGDGGGPTFLSLAPSAAAGAGRGLDLVKWNASDTAGASAAVVAKLGNAHPPRAVGGGDLGYLHTAVLPAPAAAGGGGGGGGGAAAAAAVVGAAAGPTQPQSQPQPQPQPQPQTQTFGALVVVEGTAPAFDRWALALVDLSTGAAAVLPLLPRDSAGAWGASGLGLV
jgi:hypothetical protein